jgi:aminoglycoside phosphotransferase (APT) family kinase protein
MRASTDFLSKINLEESAAALARLFPGLERISPLQLLDQGFSSFVVETAASVVFRIARHAAAGQGYFREKATLPELAPQVPLPIPCPAWFAAADAAFPYGVLGYPGLPGRTFAAAERSGAPADLSTEGVRLDLVAADLGQFLAALHRVRPSSLPSVEIQLPHQRRGEWEAIRGECLPALVGPLGPDEYYKIAGWWDEFLSDLDLDDYTPVVRHGDFWYGNLLIDEHEGNVSAVLDFEKLAASDPADDFAVQYHLGEDFAEEVLELYHEAGGPRDAALPRRARRLWEIRHFEGLRWAVRFGDAGELAQAVEKLRGGPILTPLYRRLA